MSELVQSTWYGVLAASTATPMALGLVIALRASTSVQLSLASAYTLSAYIAFSLRSIGLLSAAVVGVASCALAGAALERVLYSKLRRRGAAPGTLLVASLAVYMCAESAMGMIYGHDLTTMPFAESLSTLSLAGVGLTGAQSLSILTGFATVAATLCLFRFTKLGAIEMAVADDPELAALIGVSVDRARELLAALATLLAGVAGLLSSLDLDVRPDSGFRAVLLAMLAGALAGSSPGGTVVAAVAVSMVLSVGGLLIPASLQDVLTYGSVVLALVLHPAGLRSIGYQRRGDG